MAYYIVETEEQLLSLPPAEKCFIDLITISEQSHPSLTSPSVIYYNDFEKGYIITVNHSEAFSIPIEKVQEFLSRIPKVYLLDIKRHAYYLELPQVIDVQYTMLEQTGENNDKHIQCYTPLHLDYHNKFRFLPNVNDIIPISKHYEKSECMFNIAKKYIGSENDQKWYHEYQEVYGWIERQGISLNERVFDRFFEPTWKAWSIKDNRISTSYNLFNTTSRPTNAFNGINFLALNKDNGSRAAFVPKNDVFIEFDFDGYHLRLIGNMLGVRIPENESIHTVLGRQYFEKDELTSEEYAESKKITFRQLYNGIEPAYMHVELFQKVNIFVEELWNEYEKDGLLQLPNGKRIVVQNATPQKLLNYYVQCLETVNNVKKLQALRKLLEGKKTVPVLVVYDSILLDYSAEDGSGLLSSIKSTLEEGGYRVKARKGVDYSFS